MDTPAIPAPRDEGEKEVLEQLMSIRDHLQLRKLDRSTYVRTQDVMVLYEQTIEQVKRLNEIRNGKTTEENRGSYAPLPLCCRSAWCRKFGIMDKKC